MYVLNGVGTISLFSSSLEEQLRLARSVHFSSYHSELTQAEGKLKTQLAVEQQLREEIARLNQHLAATEQDRTLWKGRCQSQSEEFSSDKARLVQSCSGEVEALKVQLSGVRRESGHELRRKEAELQRCRGQLSHSGSATKLLEERVRQLEQQLDHGASKKVINLL